MDEGGLRRVHVLVLVNDHVAPGKQVRPAARGVGGLKHRAVVVGGTRVGELLLIAPPHSAADAPQRPDVGRSVGVGGRPAGRRTAAPIQASTSSVSGPGSASGSSPASAAVLTVHRSGSSISTLRRPLPAAVRRGYLGHARSVAVPGALQARQAVARPLPDLLGGLCS